MGVFREDSLVGDAVAAFDIRASKMSRLVDGLTLAENGFNNNDSPNS